MVYLHAFQIFVWAKNDILIQKFFAMRPDVDALKRAIIIALIRPGLKVLMRLIVKAQRLCSMRPSGWH